MQSNGTLVSLRNDTAAWEHRCTKFALRSTFDFERPPRRCVLSQTQRGVTAINKPFSIRRRGRRVGFIAEWCSTSKWLSHRSPKSLDTPFIFSVAAAFLSTSQFDEAFWERLPLNENCCCFSICLPNRRKDLNDFLFPVFYSLSFQCFSQATDPRASWCTLTLTEGSNAPSVSMNRRWLHCFAVLASQPTWLVGTLRFKTRHMNPQTSSGLKPGRKKKIIKTWDVI